MQKHLPVGLVAGIAMVASAQDFEIYLVAPSSYDTHQLGETCSYTIEVWGRVSGDRWVDGLSAMGWFGIDVVNVEGGYHIESISGSHIDAWASGFGVEGAVVGKDLIGTGGGQLANVFGILNPNIDLSNPIRLFSFDVTLPTHIFGWIEYVPTNPDENGALAFYPDNEDGHAIIAPNHDGTTLTLTGVRTRIVDTPSPGALGLLGLGAALGGRRRRE